MFKEVFVLSKVRTVKEAVGFYLVYFLLLGLIGLIIMTLLSEPPDSLEEGFQQGQIVGQYFWSIACLVLSFLVLYKKKQLNSVRLILIALLSGAGAVLLGGLLGLIPTAYLTTKESKNIGDAP